MVEQKREKVKHAQPDKAFVIVLAVGIYSILAAIISYHFFQFLLIPYILVVSAIGYIVSFTMYFTSPSMKEAGFKKTYMDAFQMMGDVFGRGILLGLYFAVFIFPGVAVAAFADRLKIKKKPIQWGDRPETEDSLEKAREQW